MAARTHKPVSMEARQVDELPRGEGWQYEPKWDGFRCIARRSGKRVVLLGRSGKSLARYFPEIVEALAKLKPSRFVLDGELVIPTGATLSFEALQMRLHPAESRIRRLSGETPAVLIAFDMLQDPAGSDLASHTLRERRTALERFFATVDDETRLRLSPASEKRASAVRWLARAGGGALDGVVAKRLDEPYRAGERAMLKIKSLRSADCVVGGFRYATNKLGGRKVVGSLLLGLHDTSGLLHHVGFTSAIKREEKPALTAKLEALVAKPGFTGNAPGGPSRWSTERSAEWCPLKPKLVVEVTYDHFSGDRFRHGTSILRWRPDKTPKQCTFGQLKQKTADPMKLLV